VSLSLYDPPGKDDKDVKVSFVQKFANLFPALSPKSEPNVELGTTIIYFVLLVILQNKPIMEVKTSFKSSGSFPDIISSAVMFFLSSRLLTLDMPDDPGKILDVLKVSVSILSCTLTVPLNVDIKVVGEEVGLMVTKVGSEVGVNKRTEVGENVGDCDSLMDGNLDGDKNGIIVGSE